MGYNTYISIDEKYRPLKDRINIVITRKIINGVLTCKSLENALDIVNLMTNIEEVYVIGGEMVYKDAIKSKYCKKNKNQFFLSYSRILESRYARILE